MPHQEAVTLIQEKRRVINPNPSFLKQLDNYYQLVTTRTTETPTETITETTVENVPTDEEAGPSTPDITTTTTTTTSETEPTVEVTEATSYSPEVKSFTTIQEGNEGEGGKETLIINDK